MAGLEVASGRIVHCFPGTCTAAAFHPWQLRLVVAGQDRLDTLLYDVGSVFRSQTGPIGRSLSELWADLADRDAGRGQRAVWTLSVAAGMEEVDAALRRMAAKVEAQNAGVLKKPCLRFLCVL